MSDKNRTHYRGFVVVRECSDLFSVRMYQPDLKLWHDWKPWLSTLEAAKQAVDRLVDAAEVAQCS
jgi:hypothetical protein